MSWYLLLINPNDPDDYVDYRIGGSAGDYGYGVAATSDGGFVVAGWSASKAGYITSSTDQANYADSVQLWEASNGADEKLPNRIATRGSDSVVVKFDKDGNVEYTALHNYGVMENARKDWKSYTKRNLWLLFVIDMAITGLYSYVIYHNPINEHTNYMLMEIWIRPTIIYGLVACFVSEKGNRSITSRPPKANPTPRSVPGANERGGRTIYCTVLYNFGNIRFSLYQQYACLTPMERSEHLLVGLMFRTLKTLPRSFDMGRVFFRCIVPLSRRSGYLSFPFFVTQGP